MPRSQNGIIWVRDSLTPGLERFPSELQLAIQATFQEQAPRVAEYMKRNAPWNDRTGDARAGLGADFVGDRYFGGSYLRLYHGVPYGIFLETRFAGKYAIIAPTLVSEGDRIMGEMRNLINSMRGLSIV